MLWLLLLITSLTLLLLLAIHIGFRPPRLLETRSPADWGIAFESVSISSVGGKRLLAWWLPARDKAPVVVLLHGWGSNAELMLPLALPFFRAGLNVLLLDARNHGGSDGDSFSSLPRFAEDLGCALAWLHRRYRDRTPPIVLLGHSVGAGAALLEASRREDIAAVISIAAFAHPEEMMRRYLARFRLPELLLRAILRYVEWVIGHRFDHIAPLHTLSRIRCPVLLVHGRADTTVPVSDAERLAQVADLELLLVEEAGHDSVEQIEAHAGALLAFLRDKGIPCPGCC